MTEERCARTCARHSDEVITQHDAVAIRIIKPCALASASAQHHQGPSRVAAAVVARVLLCPWRSCVIVQHDKRAVATTASGSDACAL